MRAELPVREAINQKGPFWVFNSRGHFLVVKIHRATKHVYHINCEGGKWFPVPPSYTVHRQH